MSGSGNDSTAVPMAQAQDAVMAGLVRAHVALLRMRNLLCLAALLVVGGIALGLAWSTAGIVVVVIGLICHAAALGFAGIAGNAIGAFGLKYPLAVVVGGGVLSATVLPIAGVLAPVAVFFWLKHDVGTAYRTRMAAASAPGPNPEPESDDRTLA